mgnify:CR=1 FL=1
MNFKQNNIPDFTSSFPQGYNRNMEFIDISKKDAVNTALLEWFASAKRDLPFRTERDPYKIWISEIMAQQTRIDTLLSYFDRFTRLFPDVKALDAASEDEVLKAWEGLGYYSRARNLKKAASEIVGAGRFPETAAELKKLPGIGPYTAGAVASIAFGQKAAAVDGNVLRVMSRIYGSDRDIADLKTRRLLENEIEATMPEETGDYNESLMELGALICSPKSPKCMICPVRDLCSACMEGLTEELPVKTAKKKPRVVRQRGYIVIRNGKLLLEKRPEGVLLTGMYGLPLIENDSSDQDQKTALANLSEGAETPPVLLGTSRHIFTHIIWETEVYLIQADQPDHKSNIDRPDRVAEDQTEFADRIAAFSADQLDHLALPTAFKKMLALYDGFNSAD